MWTGLPARPIARVIGLARHKACKAPSLEESRQLSVRSPIRRASTSAAVNNIHAEAVSKSSRVQSAVGPNGSPLRVSSSMNILESMYTADYHAAVAKIIKLRDAYIHKRFVFVKHDVMLPLLKGLGAKDEDFALIKGVSDNLAVDPTLPFRESKNGRFCFDPEKQSIRRLEYQPFALSVTEDFKRHDSDQLRHFAEIRDDLQLNSVFQALLLFKNLMLHNVSIGHRRHLNYDDARWICTVFNLRTITTPTMVGEPALEGVHTDGVDHTMTTFLGSENMESQSCATALHSMEQETGIAHDKQRPEHCCAVYQHCDFLDTLMIADNERKHSLSALAPDDPSKRATRDMLIFFTRKPAARGHVSEHIDSKKSHRELPMNIPLWLP